MEPTFVYVNAGWRDLLSAFSLSQSSYPIIHIPMWNSEEMILCVCIFSQSDQPADLLL